MKKYLLNSKVQIIISILMAIIIGKVLWGNEIIIDDILKPIGDIFINLIKCFMIPLIFFSIVNGIINLGSIKRLKEIGVKIIIFFIITTILASIIGLTVGSVFNLHIENLQDVNSTEINFEIENIKIISSIFSFIPENIIDTFLNGNIIQIIFLSIISGCILLKYGEKLKTVLNLCNELNEFLKIVMSYILKIVPIGIFVLLTPVIMKNNLTSLMVLGKVMIAYTISCIIHVLLIYFPIIIYTKKVSLKTFCKNVFPALILAFSSASSLATLATTMECSKKIGIKDEIGKFTLPLGATINMDGTAIFLSIISLFIASSYGIELNIIQLFLIVIVTVATSIGTPGVPGASLIIIAITLESVGLPLNGIGLIAGIDIILEMLGTAMNVLGDIVCTLLIDKKYNIKKMV